MPPPATSARHRPTHTPLRRRRPSLQSQRHQQAVAGRNCGGEARGWRASLRGKRAVAGDISAVWDASVTMTWAQGSGAGTRGWRVPPHGAAQWLRARRCAPTRQYERQHGHGTQVGAQAGQQPALRGVPPPAAPHHVRHPATCGVRRRRRSSSLCGCGERPPVWAGCRANVRRANGDRRLPCQPVRRQRLSHVRLRHHPQAAAQDLHHHGNALSDASFPLGNSSATALQRQHGRASGQVPRRQAEPQAKPAHTACPPAHRAAQPAAPAQSAAAQTAWRSTRRPTAAPTAGGTRQDRGGGTAQASWQLPAAAGQRAVGGRPADPCWKSTGAMVTTRWLQQRSSAAALQLGAQHVLGTLGGGRATQVCCTCQHAPTWFIQ